MDVRRLPRETVDKFTSDFKIVADYFWQLENNKEYKANKDQIRHVEELLDFFQYATDDMRFLLNKADLFGERMANNMEGIFTTVEKKGIKAGEEIGEKRAYERLSKLIPILLSENNTEALEKITKDPEYREELFKKYNIWVGLGPEMCLKQASDDVSVGADISASTFLLYLC